MRLAHRSLGVTIVILALAVGIAPGCKSKGSPPVVDKLVVVKAVWGARAGEQKVDVTQTVAGMVKGNALTLVASVEALGEPASGKSKELRIEWSRGGNSASRRILEGDTLTIRADEKPAPNRLVVRRAVYGNFSAGKTVDITAKIADMASNNTLSVTPGNHLVEDPAPTLIKQLRVDYTFDGVEKSKTGNETEPLTIP